MNDEETSFQENTLWALMNFCRGKPLVNLDKVEPIIEICAEYIEKDLEDEDLSNICWTISYLMDGDDERAIKMMPFFRVERLISLMEHKSEKVIIPATRSLGNIVSGNDQITQKVLDAGLIPMLEKLTSHSKETILKEVYWITSNIAAGTTSQTQASHDLTLFFF